MSSIRPLATITLLAAMGVFLYLKINEPPESASSKAPAEWEGAPKFEFGDAAPSGAPLAEAAPPITPPAATPSAESTTPTYNPPSPAPTAESPPSAAPPLPDLPPTTSPSAESAPSESVAGSSSDLPPSATSPSDDTNSTVEIPSAAETSTAASSATDAPTGLPPIPELPPLPEATAMNEAPSAAAPAPSDLAETPAPPAATPSESPFDAARPAIHAALSQDELARALQLVSKWYNDPALLPEEKGEVQTLLNQLAGTVVYSNEHHLDPAYTVQAGETLETIAAKHQIPWQLLAKINGIASATAIQAGQTIKVIRGPFMGVVDVSDAEIALFLDGRFAGKFPVQLDGAAINEGEWTVEQKQLDPAHGASHGDRKLVLRSGDNPSAAIVITSTATALAGTTPPQGTIRIAPEQTEDLYDILSIGSRVVIRK